MDPAPAVPAQAPPAGSLRSRLEAMAQRVTAADSGPPAAPEGRPPTDEEAMANLMEAFPGAVLQETVHRNT